MQKCTKSSTRRHTHCGSKQRERSQIWRSEKISCKKKKNRRSQKRRRKRRYLQKTKQIQMLQGQRQPTRQQVKMAARQTRIKTARSRDQMTIDKGQIMKSLQILLQTRLCKVSMRDILMKRVRKVKRNRFPWKVLKMTLRTNTTLWRKRTKRSCIHLCRKTL